MGDSLPAECLLIENRQLLRGIGGFPFGGCYLIQRFLGGYMELTLGEATRYVLNEQYAKVAAGMYTDAFHLKNGETFNPDTAADKAKWLNEIEAKLKEIHSAKKESGTFSQPRHEIAQEAYVETKLWLEKLLGIKGYEEKNKGFHLGLEFKDSVK